jgi:methionyl aminopeptidase
MIYYKSAGEIELIRNSSLLVARTLGELAKLIKPGVTTLELDRVAEEFIRDHGGVPAFKGYGGFPNTLCTSPNAVVVHGIPSDIPLENGDIVSVDCGVLLDGYFGDSAFTFPVGNITNEVQKLLETTRECLRKGIENAISGKRLGDVCSAIQDHAENHGYSVVRELVGHGIGKNLHEKPEVPNFGKKGSGLKLSSGLVLAIEPMINMGKRAVKQLNDGWTIKCSDGLPSAHFEHTVAVEEGKADILSSFKYIDEELAKRI